MNKYFLLICYIIFFINGCNIINNNSNNSIQKKTDTILLDFNSAIQNVVTKMLQLNNILDSRRTLFFIDFPENQANLLLDNNKLINIIKTTLTQKNNDIYFLDPNIIEKNKKKLGISNINNNLNTSTAMLLARNNHATHYLRSVISGKQNPYTLKIELVLVSTGEIVFTQLEKFYWKQ